MSYRHQFGCKGGHQSVREVITDLKNMADFQYHEEQTLKAFENMKTTTIRTNCCKKVTLLRKYKCYENAGKMEETTMV